MDQGDRRRAAWALYEWAQQPYWALIATFIFTPYFAAGFVGAYLARRGAPRTS